MSVKSETNEKITLNVLTKFIRPYNGDRETLPAFLTNCDNAISLAAPEQQNILCKYIISQLEGKAQLACSLKTFSKWQDLKAFIRTTFGEKKHSSHLLVDLQNCKQLPSETVTQFSLRLESCLTRIQADIHYSCRDENQLEGRIAAMEDLALNTFIMGLNNANIATILRCRSPRDLNEAISHAVEEEKIQNLCRISQRTAKSCSICHKQGHSSSECFRNRSRSDNPHSHKSYHMSNTPSSSFPAQGEGRHMSNYKNNYFNSYNNYQNNIKFCSYCKNRGHLIAECRKRQYFNDRRAHSNNLQSDSAANTSATNSSNTNAPNNTKRVYYCPDDCNNIDNSNYNEDEDTLNEN